MLNENVVLIMSSWYELIMWTSNLDRYTIPGLRSLAVSKNIFDYNHDIKNIFGDHEWNTHYHDY
jgi:hypothetical protein